jgi:Fe/S biogenesis protein NfuA
MMDGMSQEKIVQVTDRAREKALSVRNEEPDGANLMLFLEVMDSGGFEYAYDLYFDDSGAVREGDVIQEEGDLKIVILASSIDNLRGATLDLSRNLLNPGWVVDNPNAPSPSPAVGAGTEIGELTGTVEERVQTVLERVINPAIAAHGGRADLAGVEGTTVYLQLSGGCQGCGMATVTLGQGIEVSLKDAIPEIEQVVDVTDHASGSNPYFQPAKK